MRNLKKVLSLTLALVMLLGMMVVGAGAAGETNFPDDAKIGDKYREAVAVMEALNIFQGDSQGNLNPQDILDRASAAKLITMMMIGESASKGFAETKTSNFFSDMKYHWAAGYVDYCASVGIVEGSNGMYNPDTKLTGVMFATMLLRASGAEDITGAGWKAQTIAAAAKHNIEDVTDAPLTREAAAKMTLEGLLVSPSGEEVWTVDGKSFDSFFEAYLYAQGASIPVGDIEKGASKDSLATKNYKLAPGTGADAFGRPTKVWTADGKEIVAVDGSAPVVAYTSPAAKVSVDTVKKDLDGYKVTQSDGTTTSPVEAAIGGSAVASAGIVVTNNNPASALTGTANQSYAYDIAELTDAGKIVEVYANSSKVITKIVVINKTVDEVTADVKTRTLNDTEQVQIPGVTSGYVNADTLSGWEDLKKGDIVLKVTPTVASGKTAVTYIEKAEVMTGKVTSMNSNETITVDGEKYAKTLLAQNSVTGAYANSGSVDYVNTWNFFLDNGGNIIAAQKVTDEKDESTVVVLDMVYVVNSSTVTAGGVTGAGHAEALVLNVDGSTEVKTVKNITTGGNTYSPAKIDAEIDAYNGNGTGSAVSAVVAGAQTVYTLRTGGSSGTASDYTVENKLFGLPDTNDAAAGNTFEGKFYTCDANADGSINLTTTTATNADISGANIVSGKATFAHNSTAVGGSNTVFLVRSGSSTTGASGYTYTAYTGIANIPGMTGASGSVLTPSGSSIASHVYLTGESTGAVESEILYVRSGAYSTRYDADTKTTYRIWNVIKDGDENATIETATAVTLATGLYRCRLTDGIIAESAHAVKLSDTAANYGGAVKDVSTVSMVLDSVVEYNVAGNQVNGSTGYDVFNIDSELVVNVIDLDKDGAYVSYASDNVPATKNGDLYHTEKVFVKTASGDNTKVVEMWIVRTALNPNKTKISTVSLTITSPVKDAKPAAPTMSDTNADIDSYVWKNKDGNAFGANDTFVAANGPYTLVVTLKIKDASSNTHEFDSTVTCTAGGKTGVWDATNKTLTFTFDAVS